MVQCAASQAGSFRVFFFFSFSFVCLLRIGAFFGQDLGSYIYDVLSCLVQRITHAIEEILVHVEREMRDVVCSTLFVWLHTDRIVM